MMLLIEKIVFERQGIFTVETDASVVNMFKVVYIRFIGLVRLVVSAMFNCSNAVGLHSEGAIKIETVATSVMRTIGASSSLVLTVVLLTTSVVIRSIERFSARGT